MPSSVTCTPTGSHGHDGQTWLSLVDTPQQPADMKLAARIAQALSPASFVPVTHEQSVAVARRRIPVTISPAAKKRMQRSRDWVDRSVRQRQIVYGVTTGFGAFQNVSIEADKLRALQRNLILSHCAGVGEPESAAASLEDYWMDPSPRDGCPT